MSDQQKINALHKMNDVIRTKQSEQLIKRKSLMQGLNPATIIQRVQLSPSSLAHADVMQLQQTMGNQAVIQLLKSIGLVNVTPNVVQEKEDKITNEETFKQSISRTNKYNNGKKPGEGILQLYKATEPRRVDLVNRIKLLIKSNNFQLGLLLLDTHTKSGELDGEDLSDIYQIFFKGSPRGELYSYVEQNDYDQKTKEKQKNDFDQFLFFDFPNQIVDLRNFANEHPVAGGIPTGPDEGYTLLSPGVGNKKIQVPNALAGNSQLLAISQIRWSQSDVKSQTGVPTEETVSLTDIINYMSKGGWRGNPAEVVEFKESYNIFGIEVRLGIEPGYVSKDNRRLLCAYTAGLAQVPCIVKTFFDKVDDYIDDKLRKNLWWDKQKKKLHFGNSGEGWTKKGRPEQPERWELIMQAGEGPSNLGELIIIRTANQPGVKMTGAAFEIGGSSLPPYMKI